MMIDHVLNDNSPQEPKRPKVGPEQRRTVLILIMTIVSATAMVTDSTLLLLAMVLLFCLSLRQMLEDEITIGLKQHRTYFIGNKSE